MVEAQPDRSGHGPCGPDHQGGRAADPCGDHLYPRRGQRLFLRLRLWPARQRHHPRGGGSAGDAGGGRGRRAAVLVRHGGGDRRVPGPRSGRPYRRLQGHVLGPAQLADDGGRALGPQGRFRRDGQSRCPARGREARARPSSSGSRRPRTRSGPSPTSPVPPRSRMRPARGSRSIPPPPRRSTRDRSRSAPTSSCMRRPRC